MSAVARLKAMLGLDTKEFQAGVRSAKSATGGMIVAAMMLLLCYASTGRAMTPNLIVA